MTSSKLATNLIVIAILLPQFSWAFETDQYNLPSEPLADIGREVEEYTLEQIRKAVDKVNGEIDEKQECIKAIGKKCGSIKKVNERLAYLRSEEAIARAVFRELGSGIIPFTKSGTWMNEHTFRVSPSRYKTDYKDSIFLYVPTNYFTISPTVNMYGVSFGTDKIAHFFQQGYTYYRIAERARAKGVARSAADKKAVEWGKFTERTYFGTMVGGVYSNADLFANYVGMKFYEGLTRSVSINGDTVRPPTLVLNHGRWMMSDRGLLEAYFLRPFITDHMNEALNPSLFIPGLRSSVRGIVRGKSCKKWRSLYPSRTKDEFEKITNSLTTWNGEDYGFKTSKKFVTIGNTCFPETVSDPY